MVFANLSAADKEAFFSLLDEYFATRGGVAAVTAAKGPMGQAAFGQLKSHLFNTPNQQSTAPPSSSNDHTSTANEESSRPSFNQLRGAFSGAASSLANNVNQSRSGRTAPPPPPAANRASLDEDSGPPPVVPRRIGPAAAAPSHPAPPASTGPGLRMPSGISTGKHFGSSKMDLTSGKTLMGSMFGKNNAGAASSPVDASAPIIGKAPGFGAGAASSGGFLPPPVRRVPSSTPKAPEPEPEAEYAEALYDYTSEDTNDLHFSEGARIRIVEKNSEDWWTGELDGKQGLVPATYVKVL